MKFTPHAYQKRGILFLVQHAEAALFWTPGLGKTAVTLSAIQALRQAGGIRKVLVVAPLRVIYQVWDALGELAWDQFRGLRVARLHGPRKEAQLTADADVYTINYEALPWLTENGRLARLLAAGVDTLVLDEVSKMKHAQTRRFKALKPFLGGFKRRWGLTGTPCANSLLDLFGVCYTLDLGRALGRFITHFRTSYFVPGGYGNYTWRPQPGAEARIFAAIAPLAQSLKAVDVLDDLPTLVERDIYVELPPPARKAYDELEKDLITVINTTTVMAPNVAAALNRCRQLTGGAIYHTPEVAHGRAWLPVHDEKVAAVVDLVEELQGAPLLVAYDFIHELERLRAALGAHTPALGGGISAREAADAIALWNTGAAPVMLVHPAAAGHGLNLQSGGGCNVCFFTSPWDYELYTQCVARIWRQGNTAPRVIVHRLIARKTVDLAVRDALTRKERNQEALFAALRRPAWRGGRDA